MGLSEEIETEAKRRAEFMTAEIRRELAVAREKQREAEDQVRMMRLVVKGMLASTEKFELRVQINSPELFDRENLNMALQHFQRTFAETTAAKVEERLGWPGVHLSEAMAHIGYLEGHATNRGLPFKPFAWKAPKTLLR